MLFLGYNCIQDDKAGPPPGGFGLRKLERELKDVEHRDTSAQDPVVRL